MIAPCPRAHCMLAATKFQRVCAHAEGISPIRVSLSKAASAAKERGGPLPPPSPAPPASAGPRRLSHDGSASNSSAGSRRGTKEEQGGQLLPHFDSCYHLCQDLKRSWHIIMSFVCHHDTSAAGRPLCAQQEQLPGMFVAIPEVPSLMRRATKTAYSPNAADASVPAETACGTHQGI